jgi:hypothetical protein
LKKLRKNTEKSVGKGIERKEECCPIWKLQYRVLLPLSLKREYQNGGGTASWSFPAIR